MSYAFSYYGAETIPEGMIDPFAQRSSPTVAAARQRAVMPVAGSDQIEAIVKGIGGHLKLVYKADNSTPMPERLADLVRRVA
jgi:hypothetical protein